jgi:fructose-1,6-bisphosphatase/inositol monophosphatase family enzyme
VNGRAVRLRELDPLSEATLLTTDLVNIGKYQKKEGFDNLLSRTKLFRTWGDCCGYLLVATGGADIMLDPIVNPWYVLPLIPIIAGSRMEKDGPPLIISNSASFPGTTIANTHVLSAFCLGGVEILNGIPAC